MNINARKIIAFMVILLCLAIFHTVTPPQAAFARKKDAKHYVHFQSAFNNGLNAYERGNSDLSKQNMKLALKLLSIIQNISPAYKDTAGLIYLVKGYIHQIDGKDILKSIESSGSNPSILKDAGRAYHHFIYVQLYYDYSNKLVKDKKYRKMLQEYIESNGQDIAAAEKLLSGADPKGLKEFKEITALEAKSVLNYDRIFDRYMWKDFISPTALAEEKGEYAKRLKELNDPNAGGFTTLSEAFDSLGEICKYRYMIAEWLDKRTVRKNISGCISKLKKARGRFFSKELKNYCANLIVLVKK